MNATSPRLLSLLLLIASALFTPRTVSAQGYTFTSIIDSSGPYVSFSNAVLYGSSGAVACIANRDGGGSEIIKVSGGTATVIASTTGGVFSSFADLSANASGTVAFIGNLASGGSGVYSGSGGALTPLADNSGRFASFAGVSINASGTAVFAAVLDAGGSEIVAATAGVPTTLASSTNLGFASIQNPFVNAGGTVVFTGSDAVAARSVLKVSTAGGSADVLASSSDTAGLMYQTFGTPALNTGGTMAFWANSTPMSHKIGVFKLNTSTGETENVYSFGTGTGFISYPILETNKVSINSEGNVAFAGGSSVYTGPNAADKVLATGDTLFGATVSGVKLSRAGIDDEDRIAITYELNNGVAGVVLSTPATPKKHTGDLLIKEASLPESALSTNDRYIAGPAGAQLRKVSFEPKIGSVATFDVEFQNDDTMLRSYTITGFEEGDTGWTVEALLGATDQWAALTGAGYVTGSMQPGAKLRFSVRVRGTDTGTALPNGTKHSFTMAATADDDPGFTQDAVGANVETVTALLVNSTGDEPDADPNDGIADVNLTKPGQQVTLRAAIQFANAQIGKDIIKFDIAEQDNHFEDGVPTIVPKTPLPAITDHVAIDGWSQDTNATKPPVQLRGNFLPRPSAARAEAERWIEFANARDPSLHLNAYSTPLDPRFLFDGLVSWSGAASGLVLAAPDCEIRGLVINHFPLCGILVDGESTQIQGNYLGLDPSGTQPRANGMPAPYATNSPFFVLYFSRGAQLCLRSANNQVGGATDRDRNVISGQFGGYVFDSEIGASGAGPFVPKNDPPYSGSGGGPPNVLLLGAGASWNNIVGNYIGCDANGVPIARTLSADGSDYREFNAPFAGIVIDQGTNNRIGSGLSAEANRIAGSLTEVFLVGSSNVVTGNQIAPTANNRGEISVRGVGNTADANIGIGSISVVEATDAVVSNHTLLAAPAGTFEDPFAITVRKSANTRIVGNKVAARSVGIQLDRSTGGRVENNEVIGNTNFGIRVNDSTNLTIAGNKVAGNASETASYDEGAGVDVEGESAGVTITQNQIVANYALGISLGEKTRRTLPRDNDEGDVDEGANTLLNYPIIGNLSGQCVIESTGLTVLGILESAGSSTFHLEFFASASGDRQGERYLGALDVTTNLAGFANFTFTAGSVAQAGEFITCTTTDAAGNTSEFSEARKVQGDAFTFPDKGVSDAEQQQVPNRASPALSLAQAVPGMGDGNGDGMQDHTQANVASFIGVAGKWLTLTASAGVALRGVAPSEPPNFTQLPPGYSFPVGFVKFTAAGVTNGGTLTVDEVFHDTITFTTVLAYGPTPDNAAAHWYEFNFNGTTGAEPVGDHVVLHFVDGGRGDHDVMANGEVTTILAPAFHEPVHSPAIIGASVPGRAAGTTYRSFAAPQSGPFAGQVLIGKKKLSAMFAGDGSVRVLSGQASGTLPGVVFSKFGNPSGDAVLATLAGRGVAGKNDTVLLTGLTDGPVRIAAREGGALDNLAGITIKKFGAIDGNGADVFFLATLQGTGVTAKNDSALCAALADGTVNCLLREGQDVGGKTVSVIATLAGLPGTLAEGRWRLDDSNIGVRLTFADKSQGIFSMSSAAQSVGRWIGTGNAFTDAPLTGITIAALGFPGFGNAGPAFHATFAIGPGSVTAANDHAIFRGASNGFVMVAREGESAAGVAANYATFADPIAGSDGRIAFAGTVAGVPKNVVNCIWYYDGDVTVALLARTGDAAPGGGRFAKFNSLAFPDGPGGGPIVSATLANDAAAGISKKNNAGLWAMDRSGALQLVVRTGQTLNVNGAARLLKNFTALVPTAGSIGAAHGYDDAGHATVLATFTDRTVALLDLVLP